MSNPHCNGTIAQKLIEIMLISKNVLSDSEANCRTVLRSITDDSVLHASILMQLDAICS